LDASRDAATARAWGRSMELIDDYDAIAKVLQLYIDGAAKGDAALLKQAFHEEARLFGEMDGERYDLNMDDFFKDSASMPLGKGGRYRAKVLSVQQVGPAATAVVAEDGCWGSVSFVDFFSLCRFGGHWKIVNKTFAHTGGAMPPDM
jgi:hypothetical protein